MPGKILTGIEDQGLVNRQVDGGLGRGEGEAKEQRRTEEWNQ